MNAVGQAWLTANTKKFKPEDMVVIREKMENMTDDQLAALSAVSLQDPIIMLIVTIFVGDLGVHRFMLGDVGMGLLMLFTGGVCGIMAIVDLFLIMDKTKEYNYQQVLPLL